MELSTSDLLTDELERVNAVNIAYRGLLADRAALLARAEAAERERNDIAAHSIVMAAGIEAQKDALARVTAERDAAEQAIRGAARLLADEHSWDYPALLTLRRWLADETGGLSRPATSALSPRRHENGPAAEAGKEGT